jgi:hypothetical protein
MCENTIMKPIKIILKVGKGIRKSNREQILSKHIRCIYGHITRSPFVKLVYAKRNN